MENNDQTTNFDLTGFSLAEKDGGKQMIIARKFIDENSFYAITLGDGPKTKAQIAAEQNAKTKTSAVKQFLDSFRKRKNQPMTDDINQPDVKLRFFKLSRADNEMYTVEEYITLESINEVASYFVADETDETSNIE